MADGQTVVGNSDAVGEVDVGRPDLQGMLADLRQGFRRQAAPSLKERKAWLTTLKALLQTHKERMCAAVAQDFGTRSEVETIGAELMLVDSSIDYLLEHLGTFMATEQRHVGVLFAPAWAEVRYQPKGVIGVISPWNYPLQLALVPLATALAAGNRVFVKPSELTPHTSALLEEMLHGAFPADLVRVVQGGPDVGAAFSALPFDHLLYTGSTAVGRLVMQAAAKNLTPVTLELGGKSPAIVHRDANLQNAVERILFGKCLNAGQTCIAVDYVLVPRDKEEAFVKAALAQLQAFFGSALATNPDYTSIINDRHRARLEQLVEDARAKGARVTVFDPGQEAFDAQGKLPPTLLQGVDDTMEVMREEIFGPLLPIVPYDSLDEALQFVNARPRPLALYYFDTNRGRIDHVLQQTHAGGVAINDTLLHVAQDDMPFGGIGPSGMGAYHGREGFLTFSHAKSVFHQRRVRFTQLFNPPYGRGVRTLLKVVFG